MDWHACNSYALKQLDAIGVPAKWCTCNIGALLIAIWLDVHPDTVQTLRACSLLFWGMKPQVWLRVLARVCSLSRLVTM